jgi:RNA binding exosome subunit
MKIYDKNNREVELEVFGHYSDDIQIISAYYVDDNSEVPDHICDWIQDNYADAIFEQWLEQQQGIAESYFEGYDR